VKLNWFQVLIIALTILSIVWVAIGLITWWLDSSVPHDWPTQ
jgi:hypothetical protein